MSVLCAGPHRFLRQGLIAVVCLVSGMAALPKARAQSSYYDRVLFDNSLTPDRYFYTEVAVQAPSTVEAMEGRLPVDQEHFHTPPNALRLHWVSNEGGGWQAHIRVNEWRNRVLHFTGDTLTFWCYAARAPIGTESAHGRFARCRTDLRATGLISRRT